MFDPSTFKFKKVPKEVWDSSSDSVKYNDPNALSKTILESKTMKIAEKDTNKFFKFSPGPTIGIKSEQIKNKINNKNSLPLFGDKDKDGILNIFDENPRKREEIDRIKRILG